MIFLDGDFDSKKGDCKHHCSPTCHPAQIGPEWVYGCRHPAWPQNKAGDFVPIVDCDGEKSKCELKKTKFLKRFETGLQRRIKNAEKKIQEYRKIIDEMR